MRNSKTGALLIDRTSSPDGVCPLSELNTPLGFRIALDSYIISRPLSLSKLTNKHIVVQIKCTRKCTSCVQYNGVQVRGQTQRELYS
jgi:hypothetical protein